MTKRRAYFCDSKTHEREGVYRVFLFPGEPVPRCRKCGKPMTLQPNVPYVRQEKT